MNLADLPQRLLGVGAPVVEAGPRVAVGAIDLVGHRLVPQVGPDPVGPATDVVLGEQPHLRARRPAGRANNAVSLRPALVRPAAAGAGLDWMARLRRVVFAWPY